MELIKINNQMAAKFNKLYTLLLTKDLVALTPAVTQALGRIIEDFYYLNLRNYGIDKHSSLEYTHSVSLRAPNFPDPPMPNVDI